MKLSLLCTFVTLALTASSARAQSNDVSGVHVFPVRLDALVIQENDSNTLTRAAVTKGDLIESDRLVLVVDEDNHSLALGRLESGTNLVYIATSTSCVIFSAHQFAGNLALTGDITLTHARLMSVPATGDIQIRGHFTTNTDGGALQASATLQGIINDSVNGSEGDPDTFLKGILTPSGHALNPDDIAFPE